MEGEQGSNLPLNATIEVESENTVVAVAQPTLLVNQQEKYNNLLGNSVRYEDDGWLVGWDRIMIQTVADPFVVIPFDKTTVKFIAQKWIDVEQTHKQLTITFTDGSRFSIIIPRPGPNQGNHPIVLKPHPQVPNTVPQPQIPNPDPQPMIPNPVSPQPLDPATNAPDATWTAQIPDPNSTWTVDIPDPNWQPTIDDPSVTQWPLQIPDPSDPTGATMIDDPDCFWVDPNYENPEWFDPPPMIPNPVATAPLVPNPVTSAPDIPNPNAQALVPDSANPGQYIPDPAWTPLIPDPTWTVDIPDPTWTAEIPDPAYTDPLIPGDDYYTYHYNNELFLPVSGTAAIVDFVYNGNNLKLLNAPIDPLVASLFPVPVTITSQVINNYLVRTWIENTNTGDDWLQLQMPSLIPWVELNQIDLGRLYTYAHTPGDPNATPPTQDIDIDEFFDLFHIEGDITDKANWSLVNPTQVSDPNDPSIILESYRSIAPSFRIYEPPIDRPDPDPDALPAIIPNTVDLMDFQFPVELDNTLKLKINYEEKTKAIHWTSAMEKMAKEGKDPKPDVKLNIGFNNNDATRGFSEIVLKMMLPADLGMDIQVGVNYKVTSAVTADVTSQGHWYWSVQPDPNATPPVAGTRAWSYDRQGYQERSYYIQIDGYYPTTLTGLPVLVQPKLNRRDPASPGTVLTITYRRTVNTYTRPSDPGHDGTLNCTVTAWNKWTYQGSNPALPTKTTGTGSMAQTVVEKRHSTKWYGDNNLLQMMTTTWFDFSTATNVNQVTDAVNTDITNGDAVRILTTTVNPALTDGQDTGSGYVGTLRIRLGGNPIVISWSGGSFTIPGSAKGPETEVVLEYRLPDEAILPIELATDQFDTLGAFASVVAKSVNSYSVDSEVYFTLQDGITFGGDPDADPPKDPQKGFTLSVEFSHIKAMYPSLCIPIMEAGYNGIKWELPAGVTGMIRGTTRSSAAGPRYPADPPSGFLDWRAKAYRAISPLGSAPTGADLSNIRDMYLGTGPYETVALAAPPLTPINPPYRCGVDNPPLDNNPDTTLTTAPYPLVPDTAGLGAIEFNKEIKDTEKDRGFWMIYVDAGENRWFVIAAAANTTYTNASFKVLDKGFGFNVKRNNFQMDKQTSDHTWSFTYKTYMLFEKQLLDTWPTDTSSFPKEKTVDNTTTPPTVTETELMVLPDPTANPPVPIMLSPAVFRILASHGQMTGWTLKEVKGDFRHLIATLSQDGKDDAVLDIYPTSSTIFSTTDTRFLLNYRNDFSLKPNLLFLEMFEGVKDFFDWYPTRGYRMTDNFDNISFEGLDTNTNELVFDVDGKELRIPFDLQYIYQWLIKDIRKPMGTKDITLRSYTQQEYTVCRSHWLTDKERDCWVVNEDLIIVLGFNDYVALKEKVYWENQYGDIEPHPDFDQTFKWTFTHETKFSRWDLGVRYGCSCAIANTPFIWSLDWRNEGWVLKIADTASIIETLVNNINTGADDDPLDFPWYYVPIPIEMTDFGDGGDAFTIPLHDELTGYKTIMVAPPWMTPEEMWNTAKITVTRVGNDLLFGIRIDTSCKQWTVVIEPKDETDPTQGYQIKTIVLGFGCVGLDGSLTGGQWPDDVVSLYIEDKNKQVTGVGFDPERVDLGNIGGEEVDWRGLYCLSGNVPGDDKNPKIGHVTNNIPAGSVGESDITPWQQGGIGYNMYDSGSVFFTRDFTHLVIALEQVELNKPMSWRKVKIPHHQASILQKTGGAKKYSETTIKALQMVAHKSFIGVVAQMGTAGYAFTEGVSTTWKTDNNITDNDLKFRVQSEAHSTLDINNVFMVGALGAAIAGAVISSAQTKPSLDGIGNEAADAARKELQRQADISSRISLATGCHTAYLLLSDFYHVSQSSHIHAGPGFVQIQNAKAAALCSSGLGAVRYTEEGIGCDVMTFIFIPSPMFGLSSGIASWFFPFGAPDLIGYDSGLSSATLGKVLQYRKYGYAHRYMNYPTKRVQTHQLNDFFVDMDKTIEHLVAVATISAIDAEYLESVGEDVVWTTHERVSIIQGSTLAYTCIEKAKASETSNDKLEFSNPFNYDYCIYPDQDIYMTAIDGEVRGISIKDTWVYDGLPSNIVITQNRKTLIGGCYVALEILPPEMYDLMLLRPKVVNPQTLLFNNTGYNCIHGGRVYHACDGYTNRITKGAGVTGLDIELQNSCYTYRADDDFKVSAMYPAFSVFGKFSTSFAIEYPWLIEQNTPFYKSLKADSEEVGVGNGRYPAPVIYNRMAILPSVMKTIQAFRFFVTDGVSTLCTDIRGTLDTDRRPDALDFQVYGMIYRWNPEYISQVLVESGVSTIKELVATIGLQYIGSTPSEAWFYSNAIRSFYKFAASSVSRVMNADRFKEVNEGTFDFVSQEVVFQASTRRGLEITRCQNGKFIGQIVPPNETIGEYYFYSMAAGMTFQGLRRFIINRFLITDDMIPWIKSNMNKWQKLKGNNIGHFWKPRKYTWAFDYLWAPKELKAVVEGWTLNDFRWATSFLGVDDMTDCKFEWLINFAMSDIMIELIGNKYVTVFLAAETMTAGGVVESEVTKIRLHKTMFARKGQYGYYSYKFNANNGIGDSERLFMWCDGPVFVRSYKLNNVAKAPKRITLYEEYANTQQMEEV